MNEAYLDSTRCQAQAPKKANGLIDPDREPRLLLCICIRHNFADNLSKADGPREAAALLPDLREMAAALKSAHDRLRPD